MTFDDLIREAIEQHRARCTEHGVDWHAEITAGRLAHNASPAEVALRSLVDITDIEDAITVGWLWDTPQPAVVWALTFETARARWGSDVACQAIATNPAAPSVVADRLAYDERHHQFAAALHPNVTDVALASLLDADELVRARLATRRQLPPAIMERLAADTSATVRAELAGNPDLADPQFERLANDPDERVRRMLAWNSYAPGHILDRLADDPEVAATVARNPETLKATFGRLAGHEDRLVRLEVAKQTAAGRHVLAGLTEDDDPLVASEAAVSLRIAIEDRVD